MLEIQFHAPAPALAPFVRFYGQRRVELGQALVVHPVAARATSMIEFTLENPVEVCYSGQITVERSPEVVIVGPQTHRRVEMRLTGTTESFVVMFQPDGFYRLFSIPMYKLTDHDFEAHSVVGEFATRVRQRLGECVSFRERVQIIDALLLRESQRSRQFDGISAAAQRMMLDPGQLRIRALADSANLGIRQFERRFIEQVGMGPKLFARIARFEAALDYKARFTARSWTDVAHKFGYCDQMHLVHDFAEFTGGTPTKTLHELETVYVEQIRVMRSGVRSTGVKNDPRLVL